MALSQFVPSLKIGYLYTYWAPLGFVLFVTICREAVDDIRRWKRDREVNSAQYTLLLPRQTGASIKMSIRKKQQFASVTRQPSFLRSSNAVCREIKSADIQVGDIIVVEKDQRVPADIVLLRTHEKNGSCFIRTDQLDGETDWKLRLAVPSTQNLESDQLLFQIKGQVQAEAPRQDIHSFEGTFHRQDASPTSITSLTRPIPEVISPNQATTSSSLQGNENPTYRPEPLTVDNILWSNTVVASGSVLGVVVYTGKETRAVMNSSPARSKSGLTDQEINRLTMLLTLTSVLMSFIMLSLKGFGGSFFKYFWRFFLLFSYIIPLALRVNLDLCKITYSFLIMRDRKLPGCIVRNTTIPEELGRLSYLMSDKTGTLTQNEMVFKKLHLGSISFGVDSMSEILQRVRSYFELSQNDRDEPSGSDAKKVRKTADQRIVEAVRALALCHNVTPMTEEKDNASTLNGGLVLDSISNHSDPDNDWDVSYDNNNAGAEGVMEPAERSQEITYQASSPDEIALVSWTETVGLTLIQRDLSSMQLRTPQNDILAYHILETFPFTSESKRMGIIVQASHPDTTQDDGEGEIVFYMKGADVVMSQIVTYTDWLDEETGNMAREGLRTLVVGKKVLTKEQYRDFADRYHQAKISLQDRQAKMTAVQTMLEEDLELVCLTGVEDKLQEGVRPTLETLRNAGIHVWMLTGDKLETAVCIAQSSRLVSRTQTIHIFKTVRSREDAHMELNAFRRHCESALIITGESIEVCLEFYEHEFIELACQCPSVVVCRCSPTQKALIVDLVRRHTQKRVAAIGDGGNDVSMIQAADVGIGLEGKEGRQASLASDFSLQQFKQIAPLLLVHGRNCYKNTSTLSQFIIHRGTIISVMQAIFSAVFYFAAVPLFPGLLMVGYPTLFTMFPVFSLILDRDVSDDVALRFPELYKELMKGRELNFKTFFVWLLISIYQGSILIYGALFLFEDDFVHIVTITFTALILTELLMVALTIQNWHIFMLLAELLSVVIYILALLILPNYFDQEFLKTVSFIWKTAAITGLSCIPLFILKFIRHKLRPPIYHKLQE